MSEIKYWNGSPIASRIYSGRDEGVVVRENGNTRPLNGQTDPDRDSQDEYAWGCESLAGKKLALALLTDALEDGKRASDLASIFTSRVISILPERWSMTRARVLSYAELMGRQLRDENYQKASALLRKLRTA